MSKLNISPGTWIVTATGSGASVYRGRNQANLQKLNDWDPKDLNDDGPANKTPPEMSGREIDEATFSKQLAERLYQHAHSGDFDKLILAADPNTLGEIRPLLHQEVTQKIEREIDKTLTDLNAAELTEYLSNNL
ncbi:MAG: host attachment protein [Hellea sp.]|nr:host attachment protein [Hellea sp.]